MPINPECGIFSSGTSVSRGNCGTAMCPAAMHDVQQCRTARSPRSYGVRRGLQQPAARCQALRVSLLPALFLPEDHPDQARPYTHRREAIPVRCVLAALRPQVRPGRSCRTARRRSKVSGGRDCGRFWRGGGCRCCLLPPQDEDYA